MKRSPLVRALLLGAALLLSATAVVGQGGFGLPWGATSGGGGTSSGAGLTVQGSLSADAGPPLAGGNFAVTGGFWGGLSSEPPRIAGVTPAAARSVGPVSITITGENFLPAPQVQLGATPLAWVQLISAGRVEALVPAGTAPGSYALTLTNSDGQSATLANAITIEPPNLRLAQVQPPQGRNDLPVSIVIAGEDFSPQATARLGDTALQVSYDSTTQLRATVPPGMAPQAYPLTVANASGAQVTLENAYRAVLLTAPGADNFENDDSCAGAKGIGVEGVLQPRTFHQSLDVDWAMFNVQQGRRYRIVAQPPASSPASVAVDLFDRCEGATLGGQDNTFSNGVSLTFTAPANGTIWLRVRNRVPGTSGPQVLYDLSVRDLALGGERGALIVVAGRRNTNDPVQSNIFNAATSMYQLFRSKGYGDDRIQVLATNPTLAGYDAQPTLDNLRNAITSWSRDLVSASRPLTIYIMDHGDPDIFYLDEPNQQRLKPQDLHAWLSELEVARPGLKVNVIIESCYAGSWIAAPGSVSKLGRVVIASSPDNDVAFASPTGAYFSDQLQSSLASDSLFGSFVAARDLARSENPTQVAWLDDNGNGVPNEPGDGQEAQQRSFASATLSGDNFRPLLLDPVFTAGGPGSGTISVVVRDDGGVGQVTARIFPPSYAPPAPQSSLVLVDVPVVTLTDAGDGRYTATHSGFTEPGSYRIVIGAADNEGVQGMPLVLQTSGSVLYMPLVAKP
jgi:hypothetical protein